MQEGAPRSASGETDEAGHFELTTFEPSDGAIPGTHVVTVYKPKIAVAITGPEPGADRDKYLAAMDKAAEQAMAAQEAGSALPAKYADPAASGLTKEVKAGDNVIDIDLVD